MLKEGIFLGKRYEILERIGSGGMADVYKGKDHKLNRYVAVKVLKSDYRSDEVFIQKFLSEAQAAAGLMHPNVVNVYDVGQDRGLYYMVMELVEGITLKDYIEKKGQLSVNETISISIQMATGIQAAHNQHIIHRDIKPQNIIISKDGKVKVTDFGIARATTATHTISTNVMGSVHYTSPEHAKGGVVDEKSDIYSAGITMYEMVTGHVPFDGDSTVTVAIKHLQEEVPSPVKEVPDIPYSLECIILKCTQKNAAHRYQNCQELIQDLKRSMVDPDGDFVNNPDYIPGGDETVMMSEEDQRRVQNYSHQQEYYEEEDEYDDGYDDYDDDYGDDDYEDYDEYDRRGGRGNGNASSAGTILKVLMILTAVIIALVIIFMVARAGGLFKAIDIKNPIQEEQETEQVSVPDLVGKTEEEAKKALSEVGLGYGVGGREESEEFERGEIISHSPSKDEKVDVNTEVKVVVSNGKAAQKKEVPNVAGQDEAAAKKIITDSGFVPEVEYKSDDNVENGKVISSAPNAGAQVVEGTRIVLYVSKGTDKVTVPSLIGRSKEDVAAILSSAQLAGSLFGEEYSDQYAEGQIIDQNPAAGSKVAKGTAVAYIVSKGKEPEEEPEEPKEPEEPNQPSVNPGGNQTTQPEPGPPVSVPDVKSRSVDRAMSMLAQAGLSGSVVGYESSYTLSEGYVISQTVTGQAAEGSTVGLIVSSGAP